MSVELDSSYRVSEALIVYVTFSCHFLSIDDMIVSNFSAHRFCIFKTTFDCANRGIATNGLFAITTDVIFAITIIH